METKVNFEQMIENEPFVTMRISFENGVWQTWYISKSVERYGFTREEFINGTTTWNDMLHPDDRVMASKLARDYLDRRLDDFKLHYRILTKAGESINITEISHINRNADGTIYCIDSVLLNLTDAQSKPDLATNHIRQQEVLNDILLSLHDSDHEMSLQIILNRAGTYLNTSRALLFKDSEDHKTCKVIYEWLNKGIISIKDLDYAVTYSTEMPEIYVALQKTGILLVNADEIPENCREEFEKEGLVSSAIFAVYLHGQHYGFVCFDDCVIKRKWDEDAANFLKNIANLISTVLYRMHVEKQLKSNEERIRQLAYTDHLTGLPNRFRCDRDLATSIAMLQEYGGAGYVLFSDLDDFKIVNDCYGHDFGDGVLKSFAEYVSTLFTGKNRVYRFGGDEFVVIIGEGDETLVKNYLDRLIARAKNPGQLWARSFIVRSRLAWSNSPVLAIRLNPLLKKRISPCIKPKNPAKTTMSNIPKAWIATASGALKGKRCCAKQCRTISRAAFSTTSLTATPKRAKSLARKRFCACADPTARCIFPISSCLWPTISAS